MEGTVMGWGDHRWTRINLMGEDVAGRTMKGRITEGKIMKGTE